MGHIEAEKGQKMNRHWWKIGRSVSKYRNSPAWVDGIRFASKREAARYGQLLLMVRANTITDLRLQVPYEINVNGQHICRYVADFVYRRGTEEIVEDSKGHRTREYILKRKLMAAVHGINIAEV